MAFTRAFLRGLGIDDDKVGAIMEAHVEVTDQLKKQRDDFKVDAEKYESAKTELEALKTDDWKSKYDALSKEFAKYKTDIVEAENRTKQADAYRDALKSAGIADKYLDKIMRLADISGVSFDKDGNVKDAEKLTETIRTEWGDYIAEQKNNPAPVPTPPTNAGNTVTREQFAKMGYQSRLKLYNDDPELYNTLSKE